MRRFALIVTLIAWSPLVPAAEGPESPSRYVCQPLTVALEDLRQQGLKIIYSSELVTPNLQIKSEPASTEASPSPRRILDLLLAPHGLRAIEGTGDILLVVRTDPGDEKRPLAAAAELEPGLLPAWTDLLSLDGELVEMPFAELTDVAAAGLGPASRYLVVRLGGELSANRERTAFDLKERIVAARSRAPRLRIALEGSPEMLEAVVDHTLAPYVDAYTYRDRRFVPSADPTARSWWRTAATDREVLARLVTAGERGDELVIIESHAIGPVHQAFLRHIQAVAGAHPLTQPRVDGIAADRVRFFADPNSGEHFLAVYAEPGQRRHLFFDLGGALSARSLFPADAPFELRNVAYGSEITVDGTYPYYLFALEADLEEVVAGGVTVETTAIIDPYEEVVKNQVFQEREREKFLSLDVMEYLTVTPQRNGGNQLRWEHRILRRRGRLAEYHHLGLSRNGVRVPEDRLLKGRIYRSEALLQLEPLEVELDETYRYEYLGEEIVDGHRTWKIRFEPLRRGSVRDGTFVSGIVWLDQETNAHRRMRTYQAGLDNALISQERTLHYGWIPSAGECFWDWRRREGSSVFSSLGEQYSSLSETERTDFRYNRPDIDEVAQQAYESDVLIHVETPPEGHRWLVKRDGRRVLGDFEYRTAEAVAEPSAAESSAATTATDAAKTADLYGDRELADVHAFSTRTTFSLGGFGSGGDDFELYPGFIVTDQDLFNRGYQTYVGFFLEEAILSLGKPNAFGGGERQTGIFLNAQLTLPYSADRNHSSPLVDGESRDLGVDVHELALNLSLGVPINKSLTLDASYQLRDLSFNTTATTDAAFVRPSDTLEHAVDVGLNFHWRKWSTSVAVEAGWRENWQAWGLNASEPTFDSYQVLRWQGGTFRRLGEHRSLAATLTYWKGNDLDRFSRLRNGRTRDGLVGFRSDLAFDEALNLSLTHRFHLLHRLPLDLRLDGSRQWLDVERDDEPRDFVGASLRFLIHGPWRLDLWPSIRYGVYSSVPGEAGHTTFGLTLARRQ